MKYLLSLAQVAAFLMLTSPALASVMVIDDQAGTGIGTGFSLSGTWGSGGVPAVGGAYSWPEGDPTYTTATYTPGDLAGFVSGTYDVYLSWGVWYGNVGTTYTVNHVDGAQTFSFDNTKNASQGAAGALPSNTTGSGSGYYLLGTFDLDSTSNVLHTGPGAVDAVMFRTADEGRFLDQQSVNMSTSNPESWTMVLASTVPSGSYSFSGADTTVSWTGLADEAGTYDLKISWGVHVNHSDSVKYLVDLDGNGQQDEGDSLVTINQQLMADQVSAGDAVWSDYFSLGSFALTADSQVLQWNNNPPVAMTVAPMVVTPLPVPEPSTLVLLFSLGTFVYCFRRTKLAQR